MKEGVKNYFFEKSGLDEKSAIEAKIFWNVYLYRATISLFIRATIPYPYQEG